MYIKKLDLEHLEEVKELFKRVFMNEPWNDDWSDGEQLRQYILDLTGSRNSLTLGYFDGGDMAALSMGHIRHWYEGIEYIIDELCVRTDCQGRGVGTAFLRDMEAFLRQRGMKHIFLLTERTVPAYRFYRKNGFIELKDNVAFAKRL